MCLICEISDSHVSMSGYSLFIMAYYFWSSSCHALVGWYMSCWSVSLAVYIWAMPYVGFHIVGTRDGRTQSARAWLFFSFIHLDGLKTLIYTQTIVKWNWWWDTKEGERTTTQTPTLPFTPNPSPKKSKNLKPNTLFFFF
jgi:hypothetical protein